MVVDDATHVLFAHGGWRRWREGCPVVDAHRPAGVLVILRLQRVSPVARGPAQPPLLLSLRGQWSFVEHDGRARRKRRPADALPDGGVKRGGTGGDRRRVARVKLILTVGEVADVGGLLRWPAGASPCA